MIYPPQKKPYIPEQGVLIQNQILIVLWKMDQRMNVCVKVKGFEFLWIFVSFLDLLHLISLVHFLVLDMLEEAVLACNVVSRFLSMNYCKR